jgi:hypothetical protein
MLIIDDLNSNKIQLLFIYINKFYYLKLFELINYLLSLSY